MKKFFLCFCWTASAWALSPSSQELQGNIQVIKNSIDKISYAFAKTQIQLEHQQKQLAQLNADQKNDQDQLAHEQAQLNKLVKMSYVSHEQGHEDPAEAERLQKYYHALAKTRAKIVLETKTTLETIHKNQAIINEKMKQLTALQASQQQQQSTLQQKLIEKETMLLALQHPVDNDIKNSIRLAVNDEPFSASQGKLTWPMTGKLLHHFGSSLGVSNLKYNGVVIAPASAQSVKAIYPGQVVYADNLKGLGLLMIIDHGHNYYSLYGNNSTLYKKKGDKVSSEETIALAEASPGLYFELRKGVKSLNPEVWCRG